MNYILQYKLVVDYIYSNEYGTKKKLETCYRNMSHT